MFQLIRSLRQNTRLIHGLVRRDLQARYVGSTMGFFWSVLFPIVNLFVFMFVFRMVLSARWGDQSNPAETALIMLAGILVWAAFAETLSRATNCLVENSNLIQKVVFPSEILPVQLALSSVVNMMIGMPIVLVGTYVVIGNPVGPQFLAIPLLLLLQVIFTLGLSYFLATLNILWRDTFHLVGVGTTVWMFMTPIFYPAMMLENKGVGIPVEGLPYGVRPQQTFAWMLEINPMHWVVDSWRRILLQDAWPEWALMVRLALVALVVFFLGSRFFMNQKRSFPDLL